MIERVRRAWRIFLEAGGLWLERNAFVHAGSLAFYTLFSLSPFIIITVSIAGAVFGEEAARGQIVGELDDFIGTAAAKAVEDAVARSRPEVAGLWPALTGLFALLLGATTVFAQLQLSLNRIWGVVAKPRGTGVLLFLKTRLLSLALIVAIGFILLVSLLVNIAVQSAVRYASTRMSLWPFLLDGAELLLSFVLISALFALIFKVLPDVVVSWPDVRTGAITTAVLFLAGRQLIAMYLAYTAPDSAYGAAGSLVLVLLWVYYSSLILFFGAALTRTRVTAQGRAVVPRRLAVRVKEELIEERT